MSNAEWEKYIVPQMVSSEVIILEAQKTGLTASEAEINELLNNSDPYAYTGAKTKDAARDAVIFEKLLKEVTKNIPVNSEADPMAQFDAFGKWLTEAKGRYEIIYADQYKPTTTTTSAATSTTP